MINLTQGSLREKVDADELQQLKKIGAVFLDTRRTRPLWFDGRFLKAQDLNREQNYFLTRQSDLAVATGTGVIEGLWVNSGASATSMVVKQGYGMTFGGERVVIAKDLNIDLGNIPIIQHLNVKLGLSKEPAPSLRARTGLYIVALRALEFSANPIASYPTHVDDERRVEDGEIIEATAVTLIPYNLSAEFAQPELRRAAAADRIFVSGEDINAPSSSLPLTMIELDRGNIRWIDNYLVRREMGSERSDVLGLGLAPQALREAHFHQYQKMLHDIELQRRRLNSGLRFAANEHFLSLPPAGEIPAAAIDMKTLTQHYFPAAMNVEVSLVPEDEVAALVEESLLLPPIRLNEPEQMAQSTSIMVLVPVERNQISVLDKQLKKLSVPLSTVTNSSLRLTPMDRVLGLRAKLPSYVSEVKPTLELDKAGWRALIARYKTLWYTRRRNLSYKESIVGELVRVLTDEFNDETDMRNRFKEIGLENRFAHLKTRGSAAADLAMVKLLSSPKFEESSSLLMGAMRELESVEKLDEKAVIEVAARYNVKDANEGVKKVEAFVMENDKREDGSTIKAAAERNKSRAAKLGDTLVVPELDYIGKKLNAVEFDSFTEKLKSLVDDKNKSEKDVAKFIKETHRSVES